MLKKLHWLPVKARIDYKVSLICFNSLNSQSPSYIQDLLVPYNANRQLRSQNKNLLHIPRTKLIRFGDRSFSKVGPTVWNSLPLSLRTAGNEATFKSSLKTYLFKKYLGWILIILSALLRILHYILPLYVMFYHCFIYSIYICAVPLFISFLACKCCF